MEDIHIAKTGNISNDVLYVMIPDVINSAIEQIGTTLESASFHLPLNA